MHLFCSEFYLCGCVSDTLCLCVKIINDNWDNNIHKDNSNSKVNNDNKENDNENNNKTI